MKALARSAALAICGLLLLAPARPAMTQDSPAYTPAVGDEIVIYTHRFNAEDFEKGLQLVRDGFTAAQSQMGQTRLNYFLVNPLTYEVVVVSFFGHGASVDDWHKHMGRLKVLEQLSPLRREPMILERYQLHATTSTK